MSNPVRIQLSGPRNAERYVQAIRRAGGEPLCAYCPEPDLSCAGLLLCGGGDLDPVLYGQENQGSHPPDAERDRAELKLAAAFLERGRPVLGICRGAQVLNVALGGTLIQDLPPELLIFHTHPEKDLVHPIRIREDSLLYRLLGPCAQVNSAHHQAVDCPGRELLPTAWSEGGVVEALEHQSLPVLGVQFHPERMEPRQASPIFQWLIQQCQLKPIV